MPSDPRSGPGPAEPDGVPGAPTVPDHPLEEALSRAVSPKPFRLGKPFRHRRPFWSRRQWTRLLGSSLSGTPPPDRRNRAVFPVVAAGGVVLLLSLLGIAAPWNAATAPARGDGPVIDDPAPPSAPAGRDHDPNPPPGRSHAGEATEEPDEAGPACPAPLSVVVAPEIAGPVRELAGSLAGGGCPRVTVTAEEPAATLHAMGGGGAAPDVWIPASTLWLRRSAGAGGDLPTSGTSIARSPLVLAVPQPVADQLAADGVWPVWLTFYDRVTGGGIPRMSMADLDTTAGALALVAFAAAAEFHWGDDGEGATFLRTINFRDHLAATDADPPALLDRLGSTPPAGAATQVGVFPITQQQLTARQDRDPATRAVPYGTCEAMAEADYPLAVSRSLPDRLAGTADELRELLRSPAAEDRYAQAGFLPPRASASAPFVPAGICANDPPPVPVPDAAGWQAIVDTWTWRG